jgi:large subunit ribosomal protein L9
MAKTEVILTKHIDGLGAESDQVNVAAGYARNYLIPQGFAVPSTSANKRQIEVLQKRRTDREAHELHSMTDLAKSLTKLICVIAVRTGDDGKMFGSVTAGMIADEMKHQFDVELDKRKIKLEESIRTLGEHKVDLHLHSEVHGVLRVRIDSTTPLPEPKVVATPAEAPADQGKGRGR